MRSGIADRDGLGEGSEAGVGPRGHFEAELELRKLVISAERAELDHMVARRKVTDRVATGVRTALDVDETTMRP
jgi:hypothetical protein